MTSLPDTARVAPAATPAGPARLTRAGTALCAALAFAAALLSGASLRAQEVDPQVFESEPPLTQSDVPAVMDVLKAIASEPQAPDFERLAAIAGEHGVSVQRLAYLTTKFQLGVRLLLDEDTSREDLLRQGEPEVLMPDDAELEVIRGALGQLDDIASR
ncbi:MAG: hypothetical protein LBT40_15670 [Deltaproteobacteria bacterium]|jgi:hypothetical protein|nr:hypothetical protein [Deltaproteobacteria bacterium]